MGPMDPMDHLLTHAESALAQQIVSANKARKKLALTREVMGHYEQVAARVDEITEDELLFFYQAIRQRVEAFVNRMRATTGNHHAMPASDNPLALVNYTLIDHPLERDWDHQMETYRAEAVVLCERYGHGDDSERIYAVLAAIAEGQLELADDIAQGK